MLKVYTIFSGDFEERNCLGIYSTPELAIQAVKDNLQDMNLGSVEIIEYMLDKFEGEGVWEHYIWRDEVDFEMIDDDDKKFLVYEGKGDVVD